MPSLSARNFATTSGDSTHHTTLRFTLAQDTEPAYSLLVPLRITTATGEHYFSHSTDTRESEVTLELQERPLEVTIDPDFRLFRRLLAQEQWPAWSRFMGSADRLVVVNEETRRLFAPFLKRFTTSKDQVKLDSEVSNADLSGRDLLLIGDNLKSVESIFGRRQPTKETFRLEVKINPLDRERVAVLVSGSDTAEISSISRRLSHYGKYTSLRFNEGRLLDKQQAAAADGIHYSLETLPKGASTAPLRSFADIVREIADNDVIYVGETHTSASDHLLQLRLIEALHSIHPDLAIGMEMFPAESQPALDDYLLGDNQVTEREFLKRSNYFNVWRYDFRYFREIFNFAMNNRIQVVGLNLDRNIVSKVFKAGNTDILDEREQLRIPGVRDLDLPGYAERLSTMYGVHTEGGHAFGKSSGFIQAQAIWDETMATAVVEQLRSHPGRKLVVLAGSQHTRKDSGIPPRVARQLPVRQASVVNISGSSPDNLQQTADYFFLVESHELPEAGKLGIQLSEESSDSGKLVTISGFTGGSHAPEAGLKEGDVILELDDWPILSFEDLRIAMVDARPGETVTLTYKRPTTELSETISVKLIGESELGGHP
jgi:uncharacterized iron-regulated protein